MTRPCGGRGVVTALNLDGGEALFELAIDAPDQGASIRRGAGWLGDLRIRVFRFLARHGIGRRLPIGND